MNTQTSVYVLFDEHLYLQKHLQGRVTLGCRLIRKNNNNNNNNNCSSYLWYRCTSSLRCAAVVHHLVVRTSEPAPASPTCCALSLSLSLSVPLSLQKKHTQRRELLLEVSTFFPPRWTLFSFSLGGSLEPHVPPACEWVTSPRLRGVKVSAGDRLPSPRRALLLTSTRSRAPHGRRPPRAIYSRRQAAISAPGIRPQNILQKASLRASEPLNSDRFWISKDPPEPGLCDDEGARVSPQGNQKDKKRENKWKKEKPSNPGITLLTCFPVARAAFTLSFFTFLKIIPEPLLRLFVYLLWLLLLSALNTSTERSSFPISNTC